MFQARVSIAKHWSVNTSEDFSLRVATVISSPLWTLDLKMRLALIIEVDKGKRKLGKRRE